MYSINYYTNLTIKEARTIRTTAYIRGLRAGILITIIVTLTIGYIIYLIQ